MKTSMNMGKIFGREPAVILALVSSAIMVVSQFIFQLSVEQQGALNAVAMAVVGVVTLFAVVEDGGLGLLVGLSKAVMALALAFGLHLDPGAQTVVMTFVTVLLQAIVVRPNVVAPTTAAGTSAKGKG